MQDKDLGAGAFISPDSPEHGQKWVYTHKIHKHLLSSYNYNFHQSGLEIMGFFECSSIVKPFSPISQMHLFLLVLRTTIMFLKN